MPSAPYMASPADVWPGRKFDWSGAPMNPGLRAALRAYPGEAVVCVTAVINGKNVRWCTRSVDIPCAKVQGGSLRFEGKLVGDGEYKSSLSLGDRVAELGTFSVEADNAEQFGIDRNGSYTPGQYVVPLSGGSVELALAHPRVDWDKRKVLLLGKLSGAQYGPDGNTLRFTATPRWNSLESIAMPTIDATSWPGVVEEQYGKSYPLVVGLVGRHRILRVGDSVSGPSYGVYLLSGFPVGCSVNAVYDSDDAAVTVVAGPYMMRDELDNLVEVVECTSADLELYADVKTLWDGFFNFTGGNPGSVGDLMQYLLVKLSGVSGEDLDLSGAISYSRQYLHAYGMTVDDGTGIKDLIEGRVVREMFGYISMRGGKYGFAPVPFGDGVRGAPTGALHLRWGRELLAGGDSSETDDSEVVNDYAVEWQWNALSGEYSDYKARTGTTIDVDNSFWLRVSRLLSGDCGGEEVQLPDLWRWYDVRSVLRLDERFRALVLRETDYDCLPEALVAQAGDIVFITDERNSWEAKPFLVTAAAATLRPVAKLYLLEWPGTADLFGAHGLPSGPTQSGGGQPGG